MVKEKNIVIHIHNDSDKKKKKRRRRKHKKGYKKGVPLGHQTFGNEATLFASLAAIQQNRKEYNEDAKQHAENYIAAKPQNLLLENGDDDQHGNRQRLLLGDKTPSKNVVTRPFSIRKRGQAKSKVLGDIDDVKVLQKLPIVEIKRLLKLKFPKIKEKELRAITLKNKHEKVDYYFNLVHGNENEWESDDDKTEYRIKKPPTHRFEKQDATTASSSEFQDIYNNPMHIPESAFQQKTSRIPRLSSSIVGGGNKVSDNHLLQSVAKIIAQDQANEKLNKTTGSNLPVMPAQKLKLNSHDNRSPFKIFKIYGKDEED